MYSRTSKVHTSRGVALRQSQGDDTAAADADADADADDETPNRVNNNKSTGDEDNENKNEESNNTDNDGSTEQEQPTTWIQQAMDTTSDTPTDPPPHPPTTTTMITQSGVAGFAVDSELGFVCLIAHDDDANDDVDDDNDDGQPQQQQHQRYVPVVISTLDRTTVKSAEALCLVQLVGGLDLGAVVFPPDILARLVAAELEEENEDESDESDVSNNNEAMVEDLRTRVTLLAVAVVRDNDDADTVGKEEDPMKTTTSTTNQSPSSPARTASINTVSTKVLTAVQKLRGLAEATAEQVVAAMEVHANADGILDRVAFSEVLKTLRRRDNNSVGGSGLKFRLTASIDKDDSNSSSTTSLVDFSATAFESIGLALRYKVRVTVSDDCWRKEEGSGLTVFEGTSQVVARFPFFRPVQELKEDAKIMDGLIPSMFFKEKPPENQDKA